MKLHRQKFEYWDDDHTVLIRDSKPKEFIDPDYYLRAHFHPPGSDKPYFLNKRCRALFARGGPFKGKYKDGEELVGIHEGEDCFIFAPGPSMSTVDVSKFDGRLTMAVNSARFAMEPTYWVMAESAYARWLISEKGLEIPSNKEVAIKPSPNSIGRLTYRNLECVISTARVAVCLRAEKRTRDLFDIVYVVRWEEECVVPPRVPAVSVFNALVSAWEMGCSRVFLIGLDLSKAGGPYLKGVPYTKEGAANPFDDQVRALSQFKMPGMDVFNGSPASKDILPFEYVPYEEIPCRTTR